MRLMRENEGKISVNKRKQTKIFGANEKIAVPAVCSKQYAAKSLQQKDSSESVAVCGSSWHHENVMQMMLNQVNFECNAGCVRK